MATASNPQTTASLIGQALHLAAMNSAAKLVLVVLLDYADAGTLTPALWNAFREEND